MFTVSAVNRKPLIIGIRGLELSEYEVNFLQNHHPMGVILFARNIKSIDQVKALTSSIRNLLVPYEPLICADVESGTCVNRIKSLYTKQWKCQGHFGLRYSAATTIPSKNEVKNDLYETYLDIGKKLIDLGINCDLAPVLDLSCDVMQAVGVGGVAENRSFGSNPSYVSDLAKEAVRGLIDAGVYPVLKHAPGLGASGSTDSHISTPIITKDLCSTENLAEMHFVPFKEVAEYIQLLGKPVILMLGHAIYECLDMDWTPTLSSEILRFLKSKLPYGTVYITDDLEMGGVTKCRGFAKQRDEETKGKSEGSSKEASIQQIFDKAQEASRNAGVNQVLLYCRHELPEIPNQQLFEPCSFTSPKDSEFDLAVESLTMVELPFDNYFS
jgi:beta-N-acetylhexosaminidase